MERTRMAVDGKKTKSTSNDAFHKETMAKAKNNPMPRWLTMMFLEAFFEDCIRHNEKKNFYCISSFMSLCILCLLDHQEGEHIQIRKYVYRNVVNVQDMKKHFNCSGIQTYLINNHKVVPLTHKPSASKNQVTNSKSTCLHCQRSLQESFQYCCLECKAFVIYGIEDRRKQKEDPSTTTNGRPTVDDDNDNQVQPSIAKSMQRISFRRHRRKQEMPSRSPFF